ncbi:MAG: PQQ-binding-like beta-propeller repeat protein [Pirellulales bacterium]
MTKITSQVESKVRRRRWWILGVIIAGLVVAILTIRWSDTLAADRERQIGYQWLSYLVAVLLTVFWMLFLAGAGWRARLIILAGLFCAGLAFRVLVRNVDLSGDLVPTFEFRWKPNQDAILAEHRQSHRLDDAKAAIQIEQVPEEEISPGYRGLHRDGRVGEQSISLHWDAQPPSCRWHQPIGVGYSGFAVFGPMLVTLEQRNADEAVVAYDAKSGRELWDYSYPAFFTSVLSGEGPRATPCICDGKVFSVGATGQLASVDLATGHADWQVDLVAENGMALLDAGIAASPLCVGPNVVVNVGTQGGNEKSRALLAFDRGTGHRAWAGGTANSGYSSPMLVTMAGTELILVYDRMGLVGYDPRSGDHLWRYEIEDNFNIVAAQPVLLPGDRVFFGTDVQGFLVQVTQADGTWSTELVWQGNSLRCGFCSPIVVAGSIYGLDKGIMACIDADTGKRRWKGGRFGHGQMLLVDNCFLVVSEMGEVSLVAVDPSEFRELGRFEAIEGKTWNIPSLVGGHLFIRNHHEMACYDLAPRNVTADSRN